MRTNGTSTRRARAAGGFTLAEIMIALGVLGVGMTMIAGALHAGIQTHLSSVDDIYRSLISENALAIVKIRLRDVSGNQIPTGTSVAPLPVSYDTIGVNDRRYPVGVAAGAGYLVFARKDQSDRNDYKFWIFPYELSNKVKNNHLTSEVLSVRAMTGATGPTKLIVTADVAQKLVPGEKIINFYPLKQGATITGWKLQMPMPIIDLQISYSAFQTDVPMIQSADKDDSASSRVVSNGTVNITVLATRPVNESNPKQLSTAIDKDETKKQRILDPYIARTALGK